MISKPMAPRLTPSQNGSKQATTLHTLPMSTIGYAQSDFHAHGRIIANRAPILHRDSNYLQMDQNELLLDPRHLGVQSGASKMISEPMVCLAQTVYLSCIKINTISKWTETSFHLTDVT
jgi:hypothetical protein